MIYKMEASEIKIKEIRNIKELYRGLRKDLGDLFSTYDIMQLKSIISQAIAAGQYLRDRFGMHPVLRNLSTAKALCESVSADRNMVLAILLSQLHDTDFIAAPEIKSWLGDDVLKMMDGLRKVNSLYRHNASVATENFRNLMLTFAEDIRVIIILIV